MAKSLGGWSTVKAVKEDAGGAKEAAALFQKQEELRRENNKIRNMFTQNMLKTFYNSMNAFDTKQDTIISESGVLDQTYTDADGNKIQMFQRTKDASHFNPFGGKFRKLKDRVEFSDEFKELLKDPNARYKFLNDPKYQKIISKYDSGGFIDWKAQDAKLAFQTEGFKEVQAAGGPEAYKEQREFDTFFSNARPTTSLQDFEGTDYVEGLSEQDPRVIGSGKITKAEVDEAIEISDEKNFKPFSEEGVIGSIWGKTRLAGGPGLINPDTYSPTGEPMSVDEINRKNKEYRELYNSAIANGIDPGFLMHRDSEYLEHVKNYWPDEYAKYQEDLANPSSELNKYLENYDPELDASVGHNVRFHSSIDARGNIIKEEFTKRSGDGPAIKTDKYFKPLATKETEKLYKEKGWELPSHFEESGVIRQKDARELGIEQGFIKSPVDEVINMDDKFKINQPDLFGGLNPSHEEAVADATNPFNNQDIFDLVDKDGIIDAYTTSVNTAWDDISKIGL